MQSLITDFAVELYRPEMKSNSLVGCGYTHKTLKLLHVFPRQKSKCELFKTYGWTAALTLNCCNHSIRYHERKISSIRVQQYSNLTIRPYIHLYYYYEILSVGKGAKRSYFYMKKKNCFLQTSVEYLFL